jgi:imidazolonepropionase-like amidohydrolase
MLGLRGRRTFDGETFVGAATVLVDGDRVAGLTTDPPTDLELVELGDVTLLPGLVDTHQHLVFDGNGTLEEQVAGVGDDALLERARSAARRALAAGITTIRDLGDRGYVTLRLRDDPDLPTILCAGPPITRVGGHCWYLGGEADGDEALRAAVREREVRGCDVVKVMVTGGALTPSFPMWASQYDLGELQAIVDEAHALGLPVAAHCHGAGGIEASMTVGVDTVEHCTFFTDSGMSEPDEGLMARLAASGIPISATLGRRTDVDAPIPPIIAANIETMSQAVGRIHALGGTIVVGTDAGIGPGKLHDVLPQAFEDLVAVGFTAEEGLAAMTSRAATACGVGDRKGRLQPGWDADVLAVEGDVASDPAALRRPVAVWRGGRRVV